MKCNAWVRREKKKGSPYNVVHRDFFENLKEYGEAWGESIPGNYGARRANAKYEAMVEKLLSDQHLYDRCPGRIRCSVEAEEEPHYGGVHARLEIGYHCDTCRNDYFPGFPDCGDELGEWIAKYIETLPDDYRRGDP